MTRGASHSPVRSPQASALRDYNRARSQHRTSWEDLLARQSPFSDPTRCLDRRHPQDGGRGRRELRDRDEEPVAGRRQRVGPAAAADGRPRGAALPGADARSADRRRSPGALEHRRLRRPAVRWAAGPRGMVAQQVLREAVSRPALAIAAAPVLALVLVAATGGQARAQEASPARGAAPAGKARGAAPAGADQPVAVIDLAPGDAAARRTRRAELEEALAGIQGITAIDDAALRAALAGERQSAQADAGRVSLAAAAAAFGAPNCPGARSAADTAVLELAAAQASGAEVTAE